GGADPIARRATTVGRERSHRYRKDANGSPVTGDGHIRAARKRADLCRDCLSACAPIPRPLAHERRPPARLCRQLCPADPARGSTLCAAATLDRRGFPDRFLGLGNKRFNLSICTRPSAFIRRRWRNKIMTTLEFQSQPILLDATAAGTAPLRRVS